MTHSKIKKHHRIRAEAVVFDMDGVLIDSEPMHCRSTHRLFEDELCITFSDPVNNEFLGSTDRHMFEVLRKRFQIGLTVNELIDKRKAIYMEMIRREGLPWREGIRDLVRTLSGAGYTLAVASSGLRRIIAHTLAEGGIRELFDAVVSGEDVARPKPSPEIYLEAARQLGCDPAACLAIEDTDIGVRSAKGAGMSVVAFPCPTTAGMDFSSADMIVDHASRIGEILSAPPD